MTYGIVFINNESVMNSEGGNRRILMTETKPALKRKWDVQLLAAILILMLLTIPGTSVTTQAAARKLSQRITVNNITTSYGKSPFYLNARLTRGDGKLSYTTSNENVALISSRGRIKLTGPGRATITITASETSKYEAAKKYVSITVKPQKNRISSLTSENAVITVQWSKPAGVNGYYIQFSGNADFSNAKSKLVKGGSKTSYTITGIGGKTYYVRVRSYKTTKKGMLYSEWSAVKKIVNTTPAYIRLNKTNTSMKFWETLQLKASVVGSSKKIVWSSSDTAVAEVDSNGLVKGKKAGTVFITAKAGNLTAQCKITLETLKRGEIITFGVYDQDKSISNGKEPLEWIVLKVQNSKALLISKYSLALEAYHEEWIDMSWEKCSLRKWLNTTFYDTAFTGQEKQRILTTTVKAEDNPKYGTDAGNNTRDKVFLLSVSEAETLFASEDDRMCLTTMHVAVTEWPDLEKDPRCWWWLRTPGNTNRYAVIVSYDGSFNYSGSYIDNSANFVRPAVWITLGS